MIATNEEILKAKELFGHLHNAKEELARMNIGNAHDEISAALNIELSIETDNKTTL